MVTQDAGAGYEEEKEDKIDIDVDLVLLLAKALTVNRVPPKIICQLYDLLKVEAKRKGPQTQ